VNFASPRQPVLSFLKEEMYSKGGPIPQPSISRVIWRTCCAESTPSDGKPGAALRDQQAGNIMKPIWGSYRDQFSEGFSI
jgi:hypothetical protein